MLYFLVCGNEVVIHAKVETPSLTIIKGSELSDTESIQIRARI